MGGSAAVSLPLVLGACLNAGTAVDTTIIVLTVAQSDFATSNTSSPSNFTGEESSGYFPLSNALESVMRLAADDINTGASSLGPTEGDLTLKVIGVKSGIQAMEGFCTALEAVGENGTFGIVGPMMSSQASLLETISNDFFGIPLITPAAIAARAETYFSTGMAAAEGGGSYLLGLQPDIFEEMNALARLILDMKTERDTKRGWYHSEERVSVLYADSTFGNLAASGFNRAVMNTVGINIDFNAAGPLPATVDISSITPLDTGEGTDHRPALISLLEDEASIVVLLAEGFDAVFLRSVFTQAREVGLVNENVQWYVNGGCAADGIFTVNQTYHDSQLAYDLRGTLGVRACTPAKGPGFKEIRNLTARWASLNPDVYPGAGTNGLTPDGRLDPTLAFAYDAVFALAGGIGSVQATASRWGDSLEGFVTESCPFSTDGLWEEGKLIRDAALTTGFVGVTGRVTFIGGSTIVTSGSGEAGSGWRSANGTTYCAMNLRAHASLGGTFATMRSWTPDQWNDFNRTAAFEDISQYMKLHTYPAGGSSYPFDRPSLQGVHLEVITEEAAIPFAMITGREHVSADYKGIALELVKSLSEELGFTYNVTVASSSVTSDEVLDWVAEGTFDLVASWTTVNADRMERVSFSFPYFWTGLSFVYRYQVSEKVSWWKMFQPFENSLWVAILLCTALVFVLLWVFDGAKNVQFSRAKPLESGSRRHLAKGLALSSYVMGALLLGQMVHEPFTFESYIITSGWIFASFILSATFTAELASFLSAEEPEKLAFGIEDLRDGTVPHSQVALRTGSTLETFYQEEIMKCFGERACSKVEFQPVACPTQDECFKLVENGTCKVTILDSVTAEYRVANAFCDLEILPDTFNTEHYGFALPKDSPYLEELKEALLDLQERNVIADIAAPYFDESRCDYLEDYAKNSIIDQNITLVDLGGVFLVLGIFVGVSLVVWLFRRSQPAKSRRKARNKGIESREDCSELQTYRADIASHEEKEAEKTLVEPNVLDEDSDTQSNGWPALLSRVGNLSPVSEEGLEPPSEQSWRPHGREDAVRLLMEEKSPEDEKKKPEDTEWILEETSGREVAVKLKEKSSEEEESPKPSETPGGLRHRLASERSSVVGTEE
ncbi:unnamed protein product [Ascophyllum nodosum]